MEFDAPALPDEALIPARLVLDDEAFDRVVDLLERPPPPTKALRELMRGEGRLFPWRTGVFPAEEYLPCQTALPG